LLGAVLHELVVEVVETEESVPLRAPVSVGHSPQPNCPGSDHHERTPKLFAVPLDSLCNQSSLGGWRSTGQPNEDYAGGAMMLSEDKLSEVLVVGNENLPGLRCSLQHRAVESTGGQLGRVYRAVAQ